MSNIFINSILYSLLWITLLACAPQTEPQTSKQVPKPTQDMIEKKPEHPPLPEPKKEKTPTTPGKPTTKPPTEGSLPTPPSGPAKCQSKIEVLGFGWEHQDERGSVAYYLEEKATLLLPDSVLLAMAKEEAEPIYVELVYRTCEPVQLEVKPHPSPSHSQSWPLPASEELNRSRLYLRTAMWFQNPGESRIGTYSLRIQGGDWNWKLEFEVQPRSPVDVRWYLEEPTETGYRSERIRDEFQILTANLIDLKSEVGRLRVTVPSYEPPIYCSFGTRGDFYYANHFIRMKELGNERILSLNFQTLGKFAMLMSPATQFTVHCRNQNHILLKSAFRIAVTELRQGW